MLAFAIQSLHPARLISAHQPNRSSASIDHGFAEGSDTQSSSPAAMASPAASTTSAGARALVRRLAQRLIDSSADNSSRASRRSRSGAVLLSRHVQTTARVLSSGGAPSPLLPHDHRPRGLSTAAAPDADGGEGSSSSSSRDRYVSPHDWGAITRDYGKSEGSAVDAKVEIRTIQAEVRSLEEQGSRYSRRLRKEGRLPGVLYGPGADGDSERFLVTVDRRDVEREMRRLGDSICSTVFELELRPDYKQRVLLRDLDRDPGTAQPTAVNFLRYRPGYPVKVPVCFVNEELCLPLKRGGMLLSINRFVRVSCEGETIPEMLLVDLTGVRNNSKVGVERVAFPPGVTPFEVREDMVLGVVKGKNLGNLGEEEAAGAPGGGEAK